MIFLNEPLFEGLQREVLLFEGILMRTSTWNTWTDDIIMIATLFTV